MKRLVFLLLGLLFLALPLIALSASTTDDATQSLERCQADIVRALNRERFLYEAVLFGVPQASEEQGGAERVDDEGNIWTKNADGQWVNAAQKDQIDDSEMDERTAADPLSPAADDSETPGVHPGVLETQQATTSDLLPPILQSFRAFQCRIAAVCKAASQAFVAEGTDPITVSVPGCIDQEIPSLTSCRPSPTTTFMDTIMLHANAITFCQPIGEAMVSYQQAQLPFITHLDGAHRTLRQFAGYVEPLMSAASFPFLTPIQEAANFLKQWTRVPCFLPLCVNDEK